MAERTTTNVSLPPEQRRFIEAMVAGGRYQTASEVVRDGLRLLEEAEHRRLIEKWIAEGLSDDEQARLPPELAARVRDHFATLIEEAQREIASGKVTDGPTVMKRLCGKLEAKRRS